MAIRDVLSTALGRGKLKIKKIPAASKWKHTFWWREGTVDFAEAQFFMRIAEDYPVLSLGVSVEKGREGAAADSLPQGDSERMDRTTWDWQRFVGRLDEVLRDVVPGCADQLKRPLNLRIHVYHPGASSHVESETFCYTEKRWFHRYRGHGDPAGIVRRLQVLDGDVEKWVVVHFAIDLDPTAVQGLKPSDAASLLVRFEPIRRRLRP